MSDQNRYKLVIVRNLAANDVDSQPFADRRKAIAEAKRIVRENNATHCEILDLRELQPDCYVDFDSEVSRVTATDM